MPRRSRRRRRQTRRAPTVSVRVWMPKDIEVPSTLAIPAVRSPRRTRAFSVPLAFPDGKPSRVERRRWTRRRIRLVLPQEPPPPSYASARAGRMRISSLVQADRILRHEDNRRRNGERKNRRKKGSLSGNAASIRSDRRGIVGFAASNNASARQIEAASAVSRALGYS